MQNRKRNGFLSIITPLVLKLVISMLVQTAAEFLYMALNQEGMSSREYVTNMSAWMGLHAVEITSAAAVIGLPILWYLYRRDNRRGLAAAGAEEGYWNQKTDAGVREYGIICVLGVAACLALNGIILVTGVQEFSTAYQTAAGQMYESPVWIQLLGLGILVPAMEELTYRGVFYRRLRTRMKAETAILVSAAAFGISHGNLVQFLFAAAQGMILAYVFEVFRSPGMPILLHMTINLTSLAVTWTGGFEWIFEKFSRVAVLTTISLAISVIMCLEIRKIEGKQK